MMVSVCGYPDPNIDYCPRCGSSKDFDYQDHWNSGSGILRCKCGCKVYIVEAEEEEESESDA